MDFRGFDSSIILILRGGIPRPLGTLPESLSQAILVGIILVGRLSAALDGGKISYVQEQIGQHSARCETRWDEIRYYMIIRRHQTCYFRKHATSVPAQFGGEIHNVSRNRAPTQVLLQAHEVARLLKRHVCCLLVIRQDMMGPYVTVIISQSGFGVDLGKRRTETKQGFRHEN